MALSGRVKRKEDALYGKLKDYSHDIVSCAEAYDKCVRTWPEGSTLIAKIKRHEEICDDHLRDSLKTLAESFITPFDREDINDLVHAMDEVADVMEDVSARFELFHVGTMRHEALEISALLLKMCRTMDEMFEHLPDFKRDQTVLEKVVQIAGMEDEGDVIYRHGLAKIFEDGVDPTETLKWKCLLDEMEDTLDRVGDVAAIVQGVLMKNG